MEILNKKTVIMLAVILLAFTIKAQDIKVIQKAFEESYKLEKEAEYKKAADKLKEVYQNDSYEINLRLGWLNYQAGLFNESAAHYERAVSLLPMSLEAKFGLVLPLAATGKWDEVSVIYQKILEICPNNTVTNYRLGLILYGKEEYLKAYEHFKKVVDLYPFDYEGLLMYAWTNLKLGKNREAKILFNKVLMYMPNDASALEGLGYIK